MEKETFVLDERQLDIIHEALTMYRDKVSEGGYEYEDTDVDELITELGFEE